VRIFVIPFLLLLTCFALCIGVHPSSAQEVQDNIDNASTYLDRRYEALQKSTDITAKLQQKLLKRLQKKEDKMLRKLAKQDSTLYKQYVAQHLTYDSIAAMSKDSTRQIKMLGSNKTIDSLKGVQRYIQSQAGKLSAATGSLNQLGISTPGGSDLASLQQQMNMQVSTDQLIQQHTNDLKQLAGSANISGLQSIQKDVFYTKAKIKSYKDMADDPDKAEENALEYLQGTEGFNQYLNSGSGTSMGGLGNNATDAQLQAAGIQTKSQVNGLLQQKLGGSLGSVQDQMGQQIQQFTGKLNELKKDIDAAKSDVSQAKQAVSEAKSDAKNSLQSIEKPDFKVNKEKGKPFWKRFEKQINFNTSRASVDGLRPAMMILGGSLGYKQNEHLSFGIGAGLNTGLGQNWQHLRISYEGVSLRAYADWLWIYGFSFQAGYERSFIPANRAYLTNTIDNPVTPSTPATNTTSSNPLSTAFGGQQQTAYIGVMKRYKISTKWNGTLLVGYNFLWQTGQGESRSPWMIRFGWSQ
jgi:outer membrane murein-binding lipoprotein Lpp